MYGGFSAASFHDAYNKDSLSLSMCSSLAYTISQIKVQYVVPSASHPIISNSACDGRLRGIASSHGYSPYCSTCLFWSLFLVNSRFSLFCAISQCYESVCFDFFCISVIKSHTLSYKKSKQMLARPSIFRSYRVILPSSLRMVYYTPW